MKLLTYAQLENTAGDNLLVFQIRKYGLRTISRESGVSPSMLCRWLAGKTRMDVEIVKKIQERLR